MGGMVSPLFLLVIFVIFALFLHIFFEIFLIILNRFFLNWFVHEQVIILIVIIRGLDLKFVFKLEGGSFPGLRFVVVGSRGEYLAAVFSVVIHWDRVSFLHHFHGLMRGVPTMFIVLFVIMIILSR